MELVKNRFGISSFLQSGSPSLLLFIYRGGPRWFEQLPAAFSPISSWCLCEKSMLQHFSMSLFGLRHSFCRLRQTGHLTAQLHSSPAAKPFSMCLTLTRHSVPGDIKGTCTSASLMAKPQRCSKSLGLLWVHIPKLLQAI